MHHLVRRRRSVNAGRQSQAVRRIGAAGAAPSSRQAPAAQRVQPRAGGAGGGEDELGAAAGGRGRSSTSRRRGARRRGGSMPAPEPWTRASTSCEAGGRHAPVLLPADVLDRMGPAEGEGGDREAERLGAGETQRLMPRPGGGGATSAPAMSAAASAKPASSVQGSARTRRTAASGGERGAPRAASAPRRKPTTAAPQSADAEAGLEEDVGDLDRVAERWRRWRRRPAASATG